MRLLEKCVRITPPLNVFLFYSSFFFQNLLTAGCVVAVVIVAIVVLRAWRGPMRAILNLGALEKHAGREGGVVLLKKCDVSFVSLETSFRWWSQSIGIFTYEAFERIQGCSEAEASA